MRKAISKGTRFDIFKRDGFTCQYCGAQPPAVVLVVDHIHPVCEGGSTDQDNLTTSCESCNQGKAGKPLDVMPNRPDADLLYLAAQQELAELRRYQEIKAERDGALDDIVKDLQATWQVYCGPNIDWGPAPHVVHSMLARYDPPVVEEGLISTARGLAQGRIHRTGDYWVRYAWGTMRRIAEQQVEEGNA